MRNPRTSTNASKASSFILYVAFVLTIAMGLFPPFLGVGGTEHAFVLTGPEWSRAMGAAARELGLTARVHWIALAIELGAIWAIALGGRWFFGTRPQIETVSEGDR